MNAPIARPIYVKLSYLEIQAFLVITSLPLFYESVAKLVWIRIPMHQGLKTDMNPLHAVKHWTYIHHNKIPLLNLELSKITRCLLPCLVCPQLSLWSGTSPQAHHRMRICHRAASGCLPYHEEILSSFTSMLSLLLSCFCSCNFNNNGNSKMKIIIILWLKRYKYAKYI